MTHNATAYRWLALCALGALFGACHHRSNPELVLRDTEGRQFAARCDPKEGCVAKQTGGPRDPSSRSAIVLHRQSLLTVACSVTAGAAAREDVRDCRALECTTDRECPPEPGGPRFGHCISGLCVDPAGTASAEDSVVLCLAGKGLGRDAPKQVEAYAMGLNCGTPCEIPKPCRQP
jgi:hypothetical protein